MNPVQTSDIIKFWVIDNPSGICIFNQTFAELPNDINSDLTAGYLFAITTLSQEIVQENIRFLQLENLRFVYGITSRLVLILLTKNEISSFESSQMLNKLRLKFGEKYALLLEHNQFFDISKFRDFAMDVEQILNRETLYFNILAKRSENIEKFFKDATNEWQSIQNSIKNQVKKIGTWIIRDSLTISRNIQNSLIKNREKSKKSKESKKLEHDNQSRGGWV
ncbi:MAG: hypothetical protein K9W44_11035 [Candidatus Lokiarchaeota archaeon]|nr:hypothetical protein [Candidatus Harpocratesius repetitus]